MGGYQNSGNGSQQYGGMSTSPPAGGPPQIVPVAFEEGTLRALCDLDCGFPLLMDRIKQSMASCRVSCCRGLCPGPYWHAQLTGPLP